MSERSELRWEGIVTEKPIGTVAQVQVQRESLKIGSRPERRYDPAGLVAVARAVLTPRGVVGFSAQGARLLDIHHADHPDTHNRDGSNALSLGFTAHYRILQERYGGHLFLGCGGENLIVESARAFSLEDLSGTLILENGESGARAHLAVRQAMEPCREFSHFVNRTDDPLPSDVLRSTLASLRHGRRGFLAELLEPDRFEVRRGDHVFLA